MIEDDLIGSGVFSHVICANGAQVWSLEEDRRLLHRPMSCEDALACHDMLASLRPAWNAFMDGRASFEWGGVSYLLRKRGDRDSSLGQPTGRAHGFLRRALRFARRGVRFLRRLVSEADNRQVLRIRPYLAKAEDGVSKMGCSFADEPSASRAQSLLEADGRYEVARVSRTELEITAKGVTKASGARFLADALGIRHELCVAFGNGANDLPMVEVVGRFVAVANADAVVREAATEVCPSVTADGVAIWIESELARTIT